MPRSPEGPEDFGEYLSPGVKITGVYIDLPTKMAVFTSRDEVLAMVRLAPEGVIFHAGPIPLSPAQEPDAGEIAYPDIDAPVSQVEQEKPVTLQGKLKSKPREGRPDRNGKATAWARLAAHQEGEEGAHLYSTTFHRHTADIALGLEKDASITVQGYPHENEDPGTKRMDTLSVINLLDYPGKPSK